MSCVYEFGGAGSNTLVFPIAQNLKKGKFSFGPYEVNCSDPELADFAVSQGLLFGGFTKEELLRSFAIEGKKLKVLLMGNLDRLAQIIARFLRHALIRAKKRFSFETVFSHESNLDDMRLAAEAGYKVYLYFVSTESSEINKFRVALRVKEGGMMFRRSGLKAATTVLWTCFMMLPKLPTSPSSLIIPEIMNLIK